MQKLFHKSALLLDIMGHFQPYLSMCLKGQSSNKEICFQQGGNTEYLVHNQRPINNVITKPLFTFCNVQSVFFLWKLCLRWAKRPHEGFHPVWTKFLITIVQFLDWYVQGRWKSSRLNTFTEFIRDTIRQHMVSLYQRQGTDEINE